MDRVHAEIKDDMEMRHKKDFSEWLAWYADGAGVSWCSEGIPDKLRIVDAPDLVMRSAVEFIRPELTEEQLNLLKVWDGRYSEWRKSGVFYTNYEKGCLYSCDWEDERETASKHLGRSIPKSHWWYWP